MIGCKYCEPRVRIKWDVFFQNSSETETLCEFAYQGKGIDHLSFGTWAPETKVEVAKLKRMKVGKARTAARAALGRRDFAKYLR